MSKKRFAILLGVVAVLLIGVTGLFISNRNANASLAMTELDVQKLTCGSCVANISQALDKVDGVESVEVSVTTGRSQVLFDPDRVKAAQIAQVITETGYPAKVLQQLTAEQYRSLQSEEAKLSQLYVAKIGERLLSRKEFDTVVKQKLRSAGLKDRPETRPQVASQVWESMKQRILLLAAAEKNQVVIQDGEVELRIAELKKTIPNFDSYVKSRYGDYQNFARQTKEDMIINRNIEENVLSGVKDPLQRRAQLNRWFQELTAGTPVTLYDASLKQASGSAGGCGGGCCG